VTIAAAFHREFRIAFGLGFVAGACLIAVLIAAVGLVGCADSARLVHPITWHELPASELAEMCRDWSAVRGCVVSRPEGDHIYTLPVLNP
jgi:hypothetical protein